MTPKRTISRQAAKQLRYTAATEPLKGRLESGVTSHLDVSGRCEAPVPVEVVGPRQRPTATRPSDGPGLATVLEVRCRQCGSCVAAKRAEWAARASREIEAAPRTWFLTLTMTPGQHFRMEALASKALRAKKRVYSNRTLDALQLDNQKVRLELAEVCKFLKRVRKGGKYLVNRGGAELREETQAPSQIRYMIAVERHKSGEPHFHLLVHETNPAVPIHGKWLEHQWWHGFSKMKLAEKTHAWYCAKYMAKEGSEAGLRVRASRKYGETPSWLLTDGDRRSQVLRSVCIPPITSPEGTKGSLSGTLGD